jgi:hypothetical protein
VPPCCCGAQAERQRYLLKVELGIILPKIRAMLHSQRRGTPPTAAELLAEVRRWGLTLTDAQARGRPLLPPGAYLYSLAAFAAALARPTGTRDARCARGRIIAGARWQLDDC